MSNAPIDVDTACLLYTSAEQDNVGVESAHKSEEAAETGARLVRAGYRSHKLKPYRKAAQEMCIRDRLKADLPDKWNYYIDRLSCHIASSGKRYRSHAATIYKWAQEDAARKAPKKGIPDYSCKECESL